MAEAFAAPASGSSRPARAPWHQRQGENDMWYLRFLCYVALGPSRSLSLVTRGRRNAYPIPAHWSAQSSQTNWKERAEAFDEAAKNDPSLIIKFNSTLSGLLPTAVNGDHTKVQSALDAGGYQLPPPEDDYDEEDTSTLGH